MILDLEDSAAPANKITARNDLINSVPHVGRSGAQVLVRIHSDMETGVADAISAAATGAHGFFVWHGPVGRKLQ